MNRSLVEADTVEEMIDIVGRVVDYTITDHSKS